METTLTRIQPDLPSRIDPRLGSRLTLVRFITDRTHYEKELKEKEEPVSLGSIDEEILICATQGVRKMVEQASHAETLGSNGLILVTNRLESVPKNPFLIPALMETTASYGNSKRAGAFVRGNLDSDFGVLLPDCYGHYETCHSFQGTSLLVGKMEEELRLRKNMSKNELMARERLNINIGGWVSACEEYTAEDAKRAVFLFQQLRGQKRKALQDFLESLGN